MPYEDHPAIAIQWEAGIFVLQGLLAEGGSQCSDEDVVLDRTVFEQ